MAESIAPVSVSRLTKRFDGITAVDGLTFEASHAQIFGLVGPDGCGKTTALRMLAGVMRPDEGVARVAGFDVVADPESVKNHISYMPQRFGLYEDLTVDENIRFYADLFGVAPRTRDKHAARLLEAGGMSEFRTRLAGKLSGGMKQKLGLACALIHHPRVILLDEPTTGVDPVSRRDFWRILYSLLAEGVTVVIATAYLDEAERCHRLGLLHRGKLLFCGTPTELKKRLPGAVLSVSSPDPRSLRNELAAAEGVSSVVLMGDDLHIVVDDPARRIPALHARLTSRGLPFTRIEEVEATVEDVFVAAIEQMKTEAAPPSASEAR